MQKFDIECYSMLFEKFQYLFEKELIEEICEFGAMQNIDAGITIIEIGDVIKHMPIVISGTLKIMTEDKEGRELLLYYLELGDTCAMTLNCCSRSSKSQIRAITEENVEMLMIPVAKMDDWMIKYKSWRNFVLESYQTRLNEMLEAVDNLAFNNMEERLFKYLKDKYMVSGDNLLKVTHFKIANDLNSSRVVISRLMKKLEEQGIVKQSRNLIEYVI